MTLQTAIDLSRKVRKIAERKTYRTRIIDYNIVNHVIAEILYNKVKRDISEEEQAIVLFEIKDYFEKDRIPIIASMVDWDAIAPYYQEFYQFLGRESVKNLESHVFKSYYLIWMKEVAEIFAAFCYVALRIAELLNKGAQDGKN